MEQGELQYHIGQLTQSVKILTTEVTTLREKVESLDGRFNRGHGFFVGMLIAASGVGAGITAGLGKLFGK